MVLMASCMDVVCNSWHAGLLFQIMATCANNDSTDSLYHRMILKGKVARFNMVQLELAKTRWGPVGGRLALYNESLPHLLLLVMISSPLHNPSDQPRCMRHI